VQLIGKPDKIAQSYQKLFSDEGKAQSKEGKKKSENETTRWGSGKMLSEKPRVKVTDSTVSMEVTYKAKQDLKSAILGFSVYGPGGQNILEENTRNLRRKVGPINNGDKIKTTWEIPNIFASGNYDISVACCDESATEFYDWLNHAGNFSVRKEYQTSGAVNPGVQLTKIERVE